MDSTRPRTAAQRLIDKILSPLPSRYVEAVVVRVPAIVTRLLVRITNAPRSPGRVPGWDFGFTGAEQAEPRASDVIRRALWEDLHRRGEILPVKLRWIADIRLNVYLGNDISFPIFVGGCIEPNEMALIAGVLSGGMVFIDVGANEGLFSLMAARSVKNEGLVLAVEPSSREVERLRRNIAINDLNNVRVKAVALSDRSGRGVLHVAEPLHPGQNTFGAFVYPGVVTAMDEEVELMTLDAVAEQEGLTRVDVVKIDVEGGEESVLRGAEQTLKRFRPLVLIEILESALRAQGSSEVDVLAVLRGFGYETFTFNNQSGRLEPWQGPNEKGYTSVAVHVERPWPAIDT